MFLALYSARSACGDLSDLHFIDAHSQAGSQDVLERVIHLMDKAGVRRTILSARGELTSADIVMFAAKHPDRIVASVRTKGRAYQNNRKEYYRMLEKKQPSKKFGAISELLLYHARKGNKAPEVIVYPDDKRVEAVLALAKNKGWPLVLHIEFASLSEQEKRRYFKKLKALLNQNPGHPFVMIHLGKLSLDEVRRLTGEHKNLYFLTSHTNPAAISKSSQSWTPMFQGDVLSPGWQDLVVQYPDRFILAFDNVWPDQWGDFYLQEADYWHRVLTALPADVAHSIAHGNAERLWNIAK